MANIHLLTIVSVIFLLIQIISAQRYSAPLGRLLTPEEGCGISKVGNNKIVGGTKAKKGAYPWLALIRYRQENDEGDIDSVIQCVGSLITSRHVLTAAHCLEPDVLDYIVTLGEHDIDEPDPEEREVKVIEAVAHGHYCAKDYTNDVAILTLEEDVEFNDRIRPICLPLDREIQKQRFEGEHPFVAGWGKLKEKGRMSKVLMQVQLPVIANAQCKKLYRKQGTKLSEHEFNNATLCAGSLIGGKDTCQGDSGGPLMLPILVNGHFHTYQIGIVSWGFGCARPDSPGFYMRTSHYMGWIQGKIKKT